MKFYTHTSAPPNTCQINKGSCGFCGLIKSQKMTFDWLYFIINVQLVSQTTVVETSRKFFFLRNRAVAVKLFLLVIYLQGGRWYSLSSSSLARPLIIVGASNLYTFMPSMLSSLYSV